MSLPFFFRSGLGAEHGLLSCVENSMIFPERLGAERVPSAPTLRKKGLNRYDTHFKVVHVR